MDKLIIYVATGYPEAATPEKPAMPKTWEEMYEQAHACREAGASIIHFHGPHDDKGNLLPDEWGKHGQKIREASGLLIDMGQAGAPFEQRRELLRLGEARPDFMGISATTHNYQRYSEKKGYYDVTYLHPRSELVEYCHEVRENGVKPNWEIWWLGGFWNFNYLAEQGLIDKPYWFNLLFGTKGEVWTPPSIAEICHRINHLPEDSHALIAPRDVDNPLGMVHMHALGIMQGCHVRLGAQDVPDYDKGVPAKSNVDLVSRIARIAKEFGREIATPDDVREMLKLPPR